MAEDPKKGDGEVQVAIFVEGCCGQAQTAKGPMVQLVSDAPTADLGQKGQVIVAGPVFNAEGMLVDKGLVGQSEGGKIIPPTGGSSTAGNKSK